MLCLLALISHGRRGWWFATWCVAVWFSIVYLGEHYVVDLLAGIGFALVGWYIVGRSSSLARAGAVPVTVGDP